MISKRVDEAIDQVKQFFSSINFTLSFCFDSFAVYAFVIISTHGYRKSLSTFHLDDSFGVAFSSIITNDDSLVHEAKHAFRYLLASVIRRLENVRIHRSESFPIFILFFLG